MAALLSPLLSSNAIALPMLQLDIKGGTYLGGEEESVVTSEQQFSLFALVMNNGNKFGQDQVLAADYTLTASLISRDLSAPGDGSFTITSVSNGSEVRQDVFVEELPFGTPAGLSKHGIFQTNFFELDFMLDLQNTASAYNVELAAGDGPTPGSDMVFQQFDIDVSNLGARYDLHFDLRSTQLRKFAPYSHDAEYSRGNTHVGVAEPAAVFIFAMVMLLLALEKQSLMHPLRFGPGKH